MQKHDRGELRTMIRHTKIDDATILRPEVLARDDEVDRYQRKSGVIGAPLQPRATHTNIRVTRGNLPIDVLMSGSVKITQ